MHELHICLSIIRECEQQAIIDNFSNIKKLCLEIGTLSGIEIEALKFSFPIAAKNTIAENATLAITHVAGMASCANCQDNVNIQTQFSPCSQCGAYDYQIIQGQELRIKNMVVS